ncbi:hypothetical protein [Novosphingobium sp. KACC 22771]|uniref:hypothetical protein n=1 Tax=Novosphingobium sp. KACC 22771 TaxID=3025670 RepID=UPI0023671B38|nr:hypothetical protein [Novosphingobium sp. KACC 22771]WDF71597.1 hypothetical protein PQ467_12390 [Novosphingobium sp. KACC 22771]
MRKAMMMSVVAGALMLTGGCASNYGGEGALAGAGVGAVVAGVAGGDVATGAAIGAAAGGVAGSTVRKGGECYRTDRYGREYRVRCR